MMMIVMVTGVESQKVGLAGEPCHVMSWRAVPLVGGQIYSGFRAMPGARCFKHNRHNRPDLNNKSSVGFSRNSTPQLGLKWHRLVLHVCRIQHNTTHAITPGSDKRAPEAIIETHDADIIFYMIMPVIMERMDVYRMVYGDDAGEIERGQGVHRVRDQSCSIRAARVLLRQRLRTATGQGPESTRHSRPCGSLHRRTGDINICMLENIEAYEMWTLWMNFLGSAKR